VEDFMNIDDPLFAPLSGGECSEIGGNQIDVDRAGFCAWQE
jgi:hypothetical protein